jgi:uncharacterized membrane protein HdeD (DUF308 family)
MSATLNKTAAGTMAALTLAFAVFAAAPASAHPMWWGHHHHGGWGPFAVAGVIGLAAGAAIAAQNDDCARYVPVYDRWGNFIGDRPVNVCY